MAQYANQYDETVHLSTREGQLQSISSNRIHPYFARTIARASGFLAVALEGHIYNGEITDGAWIDTQHLQIGDELLGDDNQWQTVVEVDIESTPLDAYNLTVDDYASYCVAGDAEASAVWVHNTCYGYTNQFPSTGKINNRDDQKFGLAKTGQNLENNLIRVGFVKPAGTNSTAHHIIAHGDDRFLSARLARDLVDDLDPPFDMNDAANGVFLNAE